MSTTSVRFFLHGLPAPIDAINQKYDYASVLLLVVRSWANAPLRLGNHVTVIVKIIIVSLLKIHWLVFRLVT